MTDSPWDASSSAEHLDRLRDSRSFRQHYELSWCPRPATFPFQGRDHLVPCTLMADHEGPCVPDRHQRDHDCERNGCPTPEPLELPDDCDPAKWPFCEARARAASAESSNETVPRRPSALPTCLMRRREDMNDDN